MVLLNETEYGSSLLPLSISSLGWHLTSRGKKVRFPRYIATVQWLFVSCSTLEEGKPRLTTTASTHNLHLQRFVFLRPDKIASACTYHKIQPPSRYIRHETPATHLRFWGFTSGFEGTYDSSWASKRWYEMLFEHSAGKSCPLCRFPSLFLRLACSSSGRRVPK